MLYDSRFNKINHYGEEQYIITNGTEDESPKILRKTRNGSKEIVVEDLDSIQSITATENTLMIYDEGSITIISPGNYTYHGTC